MRSRFNLNEVFEPEQIAIIESAYHRALEFLRKSGDADGDEHVCEHLAMHVIAIGRTDGEPNALRLTNLAIAKYRAQRARDIVQAAQRERLKA